MVVEDTAPKAVKPATLLDAINALEALRNQLSEFLKMSLGDTEAVDATTILDARNRILQVNRDLCEMIESLERKRAQLQEEFGEPLF